jgi:hypothetical protein
MRTQSLIVKYHYFIFNRGVWRKVHNEELNDLYSSPNILLVIKSRRMRWVGHVARMEERRDVYRVLVGKSEGKRPLGDPGVGGRIILKWIFRKWGMGLWTGSSWLRIGTGVGTCECGNEPSGFIKCREFLD